MITLTEEQWRELDAPEPIVIDPRTSEEYVLVRRHVYERFKGLLEEDDARVMYAALADLDPEDWEDAAAYEAKP
jgi:hypothetical protein